MCAPCPPEVATARRSWWDGSRRRSHSHLDNDKLLCSLDSRAATHAASGVFAGIHCTHGRFLKPWSGVRGWSSGPPNFSAIW